MTGEWKAYLGQNKGAYVVDLRFPDRTRKRITLETSDRNTADGRYRVWLESVYPQIQEDWAAKHAPAKHVVMTGPNPSLRVVFDYYTDQYLINGDKKPKSIQKAKQVLRDFELWCGVNNIGRIQQVSRQVVDRWQSDLRTRINPKTNKAKSPKTISVYLMLLRAAFNAAEDAEIIERSPVKKFNIPKVERKEKRAFSVVEIQAMLDTIHRCAPGIYAPVLWAALTGDRVSDIVDLRWGQVDLVNAFVERKQVKTHLKKYSIPKTIVEMLWKLKSGKPDAHVFLNEDGQPFTENSLYRRFTRALEAAEYPRKMNLLDLRNTYATRMANDPDNPMPIHILQVQMGKNDIDTTLGYVREYNAAPYVDRWGKILTTRGHLKLLNKDEE